MGGSTHRQLRSLHWLRTAPQPRRLRQLSQLRLLGHMWPAATTAYHNALPPSACSAAADGRARSVQHAAQPHTDHQQCSHERRRTSNTQPSPSRKDTMVPRLRSGYVAAGMSNTRVSGWAAAYASSSRSHSATRMGQIVGAKFDEQQSRDAGHLQCAAAYASGSCSHSGWGNTVWQGSKSISGIAAVRLTRCAVCLPTRSCFQAVGAVCQAKACGAQVPGHECTLCSRACCPAVYQQHGGRATPHWLHKKSPPP